MADFVNTATLDAVKTVELAPTVIAGLNSIANDISTDTAGHAGVIKTASDALSAAKVSLQTVAASGAIGNNDAANINAGLEVATQAAALVSPVDSLIAQIEAFLKKIF